MGSIVSANKDVYSDQMYSSEQVAMQARLRQSAIDAQPSLVRKLLRTEAYAGSSTIGTPDWYPAGISPWYLDENGVIILRTVRAEAQDKTWMNNMGLTKRELHRSAVLIQKTVRGHQARCALQRQHDSALKIQRRFRRWKGAGNNITPAMSTPLLHAPYDNYPQTKGYRVLSAEFGTIKPRSNRSHDIHRYYNDGGYVSDDKDDFTFTWNDHPLQSQLVESTAGTTATTWSQDNSFCVGETSTEEQSKLHVTNAQEKDNPFTSIALGQPKNNKVSRNAENVQQQPTTSNAGNSVPTLNGSSMQQQQDVQDKQAGSQFLSGSQRVHARTSKPDINLKLTGQSKSSSKPTKGDQRINQLLSRQLSHATPLTSPSTDEFPTLSNVSRRTNSNPTLGERLSDHADTRDANINRTEDGEESRMYPAMVPGSTLKQMLNKSGVKGFSEWTDNGMSDMIVCQDGVCGVKRMNLEVSERKWLKPNKQVQPSRVQQKPRERIPKITPPFKKVSHVRPKERKTKRVKEQEVESNVPKTTAVESDAKTTVVRFSTEVTEICEIKKEVKCAVTNVDSMMRLLSEGIDKPEKQINAINEENPTDTAEKIDITPELVHTVHTVLKRQLTRMYEGEADYSENSILIKPSDVESLLRAAEFRGDIVRRLKHLTSSIRLDYYQLMDDIERTQFYAAQQVEAGLTNYYPQFIVLISSTTPKCELLKASVRSDVMAHIYDFQSKPEDIIDAVQEMLNSFKVGAKAKNIAIVCKGGPGHFYLVHKVPVTPAKLRTNEPLLEFWRSLGKHMSKLIPGQSTIHLMESNMAGNRQGEKLLEDLESVMYANQVRAKCPLEMAPSGREMIKLYFDPAKYKMWKMTRYTKLNLFK